MEKKVLRLAVGLTAVISMVFGLIVAGVEQRVIVGGVPQSFGRVRKGNVATFDYTIRNLTPFVMQVHSQQDGCTDKAPRTVSVPRYGTIKLTATIDTSTLPVASQKVGWATSGFCGDYGFISESQIAIEVVDE